MSQEHLGTVVVASTLENRGILRVEACVRRVDGPTREDPGQCDDVLLRVSAIGAQRVQFHYFACEILIEPLLFAARAGAARGGAQRVIEIDQHRRMLCCCKQQVAEAAENKGTDCLLLIIADPKIVQPFARKYVEMVEPEIDHNLL